MKKSLNKLKHMNMIYLATLDSYDILNNKELMWLLSSDIEEERIIAALLLRDRQVENPRDLFNYQVN
jgi:hypothetical protein